MYRYTPYCAWKKRLPGPPSDCPATDRTQNWLKGSRYTSLWLRKLGFNCVRLQVYLYIYPTLYTYKAPVARVRTFILANSSGCFWVITGYAVVCVATLQIAQRKDIWLHVRFFVDSWGHLVPTALWPYVGVTVIKQIVKPLIS